MNEIIAIGSIVMIAIVCMHTIDWIMHDGIGYLKKRIYEKWTKYLG